MFGHNCTLQKMFNSRIKTFDAAHLISHLHQKKKCADDSAVGVKIECDFSKTKVQNLFVLQIIFKKFNLKLLYQKRM